MRLVANYVGAVRFEDGSLLYFSHQGTTEIARRQLFSRPEDVAADQSNHLVPSGTYEEETVEVMPYHEHGSQSVAFMSRASRAGMLITGPRSVDEADREERAERAGMYPSA